MFHSDFSFFFFFSSSFSKEPSTRNLSILIIVKIVYFIFLCNRMVYPHQKMYWKCFEFYSNIETSFNENGFCFAFRSAPRMRTFPRSRKKNLDFCERCGMVSLLIVFTKLNALHKHEAHFILETSKMFKTRINKYFIKMYSKRSSFTCW